MKSKLPKTQRHLKPETDREQAVSVLLDLGIPYLTEHLAKYGKLKGEHKDWCLCMISELIDIQSSRKL